MHILTLFIKDVYLREQYLLRRITDIWKLSSLVLLIRIIIILVTITSFSLNDVELTSKAWALTGG